MNFAEMTIADLEKRKAEISGEVELEGADLNALEEEVRGINAELEKREATAKEEAEKRNAIAKETEKTIVVEERHEETKMNEMEVRSSKAYVDAFAEYIKSENDAECRALLSENAVDGTVPVPTMVYDIVKTAWEKEGIVAKVKKAYLKGNLKVGFEISSTGATVHDESTSAVAEETLTLGVVNIVPKSIKKWISVSDEVMDLRGEAFLRYVYDELAYQIAKKCADELVASIKALGTSATSSTVAVPTITATQISVALVSQALGKLSDEASNPTVMMNKATWSEFKATQYNNKYAVDPFEGLDVVFNNTITAFADATTGVPYVIVGDLGQGALLNFPNGEGIGFKFDDKTEMAKDLVRILGREYVGIGIVANNAFVKITK